ncbi:MAG: hypothetical protein HXX11_05885 [Desulfuromonadales bacterium]|nr:hypothetical protein [Desulfuromonadales bacterium]
MQNLTVNMHSLTHAALDDLQSAFQNCSRTDEGLILSALVKVKTLHDLLPCIENSCSDSNPGDYFQAA